MEYDRVNKGSHMFKTRCFPLKRCIWCFWRDLFEQSRSSPPHRKRLFKRKNKRLLVSRCLRFIYANSLSPFFSNKLMNFSTLARAVSIPQRTTDLASFSADGLIQWGHAGRRLKDYSCSPPWNTLLNNDNCDGREQAGYWAKTKATLTGRAKLSISSCYHCLIVSKCRSRGTKKRERQVPACRRAWVHVLCVCMSTRAYASTCEPAGFLPICFYFFFCNPCVCACVHEFCNFTQPEKLLHLFGSGFENKHWWSRVDFSAMSVMHILNSRRIMLSLCRRRGSRCKWDVKQTGVFYDEHVIQTIFFLATQNEDSGLPFETSSRTSSAWPCDS